MCPKFAFGMDCDGSTATADNVPKPDFYFPGTRFLYLDIFASWPDTPWSLRCQDRDYQRVKGTGGPAVYGFLGPAWIRRFYQTESRGSTRPIRRPHSALNWERQQQQKKPSSMLQSCVIFVASEFLSAQTDLEVCTPWVCHWARSPLGRRGGISHSAGTGPVGTACTYHCSHRPHSLPGTLQRKPRWGASVLREAKSNPKKHWDSYWERIPFVLRCGQAPPGRSPGICPGEGKILLGIVCRSSWQSRSHTLTCTLDKETQTHRQRLFKP